MDPHAGMDGQCVRVHDSRLLSIERFPQILNLLFMKSQFKDDITVWATVTRNNDKPSALTKTNNCCSRGKIPGTPHVSIVKL